MPLFKALRGLPLTALFTLAACGTPPEKVTPALWEVTGPAGERGWLLGTVHALPEPVDWRSPKVDAALQRSDILVLEITDSGSQVARIFNDLSKTPDLIPIEARLSEADSKRLSETLHRYGITTSSLKNIETWGIAITLAQRVQSQSDAKHGLEAELKKAVAGKPITEMEGAATQLSIFDQLPEIEQRDLLNAVIDEARTKSDATEADRLIDAWKIGDVATIEQETRQGMLADPELRSALLVERNVSWTRKIDGMLKSGKHPFVAVGAAHLAGSDGLPDRLARQGYTVTRIQ